MIESDEYIIRNMTLGDVPYIMSTLLRELRSNDNGPLPDRLWYKAHRDYIESLFANPTVSVRIMAASDQPSEIIGYIIGVEGDLLIWIHIRRTLRKHGLAKVLLNELQLLSAPEALIPVLWLPYRARQRLRTTNCARGRRGLTDRNYTNSL